MKPAPEVLIRGMTENGIDLTLSVWIMNPETGNSALQSALYLNIWRAFESNAIKFARAIESSKSVE